MGVGNIPSVGKAWVSSGTTQYTFFFLVPINDFYSSSRVALAKTSRELMLKGWSQTRSTEIHLVIFLRDSKANHTQVCMKTASKEETQYTCNENYMHRLPWWYLYTRAGFCLKWANTLLNAATVGEQVVNNLLLESKQTWNLTISPLPLNFLHFDWPAGMEAIRNSWRRYQLIDFYQWPSHSP